jgi:hypothetical protein
MYLKNKKQPLQIFKMKNIRHAVNADFENLRRYGKRQPGIDGFERLTSAKIPPSRTILLLFESSITHITGHVAEVSGNNPILPGRVPEFSGHVTAAPGHVTAAPGHVTAAPGHVTAAPGHVTAAPGHVPAAPGHVTATPGHVTTAPERIRHLFQYFPISPEKEKIAYSI